MFDQEENEELMDPTTLPIYQKGMEIFEVVKNICDLIPEENKILNDIKGHMLTDAMMLSVKIAGAEAGDLYDIRMECAAIIRKAANDLMVQKHSLSAHNFEHAEYFEIVRKLIEEYRLLFIDWVVKFDKWNYIIDRWGLFNPPGVDPFDNDPDDDIPFNPEEE
jgi:enolase